MKYCNINNLARFVKSRILLLSGFFVIQTAFGQSEFQPGYIVTLKGDTLSGFVKYKVWNENLNKISFTNQEKGQETIYTPTDIKGFGVENEIYESAIVEQEISPDNINELDHNSDLKFGVDTTFLQSLVKGTKSLYYSKDKTGKYQFYIGLDSGFKLLYYKRYIREQNFNGDTHRVVAENKTYAGQLTVYLQDCPEIVSVIEKIKYTTKSMQWLFDFYYQKVSSQAVFKHQEDEAFGDFGIVAGVTGTTITFKGSGFELLENLGFKTSVNFSAGLYYNLVLPRNFRKWSVNNELIYTSFSTKGSYSEYDNPEKYKNTSASLSFSYLKLNNLLRYSFRAGKSVNLFLNGGITNGIIVKKENNKIEESRFYSTERITTDKLLDDIRSHELGFILGIGSKIKRYSLEIRGESGNGMSVYNNLSSNTTRYSLLFGYSF